MKEVVRKNGAILMFEDWLTNAVASHFVKQRRPPWFSFGEALIIWLIVSVWLQPNHCAIESHSALDD